MCVLCPPDSDFKGYSRNFYLYYGKEDYAVDDPCASNLSVWENIVVHIMDELFDSERHVITDHWHTSLRLDNYLESRHHPNRSIAKQ